MRKINNPADGERQKMENPGSNSHMHKTAGDEEKKKDLLQQRLVVFSFVNLLWVALLGVLLRAFPFLPSFSLTYKNILHGHSHFAFSGWLFPVLLALVMKYFPTLTGRISYKHWRNITGLVLLSAYGMLFSFPLQGYKAVSISFSTLSIVATVYLTLIIWRAARPYEQTTSVNFLKWGLLYACLSSLGPFAIGPIVALGKAGSVLYFDAIYFYLHFQYNGFFTFMVLALVYRLLEQRGYIKTGQKTFLLFTIACGPTYALSVLWSEPSFVFNLMGGAGAALQLAGLFYLLNDIATNEDFKRHWLFRLSLSAFVLKLVLQLASAIPSVALLAYQSRNFVIAYLHLVLLGFISLFVFGLAVKESKVSRFGVRLFFISFVATELLLVLQASSTVPGLFIRYYAPLLLACSVFFPVGIAFILFGFIKRKEKSFALPVKPFRKETVVD